MRQVPQERLWECRQHTSARDLRCYVMAGKRGTRARARDEGTSEAHARRVRCAGTRGGHGVDGTEHVGTCRGAQRRARGTGATRGGGQMRAEGAQSPESEGHEGSLDTVGAVT